MTTDSILLFYGYPDGGCEISAARQCLILFVQETVYDLLPVFFGLDGVLYSMPVSDVLTAVISAVLIVKTYKQLSMPVAKA